MIDDLTRSDAAGTPPAGTPDTSATPAVAPAAPHPALGILAEIETVLRDLDAIPAHIAAWVKAKLAEVKGKL